MNLVIESISAL